MACCVILYSSLGRAYCVRLFVVLCLMCVACHARCDFVWVVCLFVVYVCCVLVCLCVMCVMCLCLVLVIFCDVV